MHRSKEGLCDYFIAQIDEIIIDHIPDNSPFNITIDNYTKITHKNKIWIIANDPQYSQLYEFYKEDDNYNLIKSEFIIPDFVHQRMKDKGLTSKEFKDRTEACQYLYQLSEELNQYMYHESISCDELSKSKYFDFVELVKKEVQKFESDKYPNGYNNHMEMIVYGSDMFALRFFEGNSYSHTYTELQFICEKNSSEIKRLHQHGQSHGSNYILQIITSVPHDPESVTELIRRRIKDIQKSLECDSPYFNKPQAIEKFDSKNQVFEYLDNLFSTSVYKHYLATTRPEEINCNNNNTQAAYIGLGLLSTTATILSPFHNYTINGKAIETRNLPRICTAGNASALQQNTTDILGHNSSEDNNTNIMVAMLVSVFATFAVVVILAVYCKNHQRRNVNRRRQGTLEAGDEQSHPGEMERISVQREDDQQLSSVNSEARTHPLPAIDNEVTSSSSSSSNTLSRTGSSTSSRSGTVSQARSLASEDSQSGSEEVETDNSQRSSSSANASQELQGTSVQNVEGRSRSLRSTSIVSQVVDCLRNSC
ncbi:MAG: hypothetical protein sL5_07700 [Candidatus Mesenet longicola]|uniref:Uncharacterized protein n=1 Tax=Candidatus Mesenet longicola TaxID=1892558 RepID=A0A8J3MN28_9RICK|nr:MAG: hypothetical protein sGL2_08270 [Candidatus Mesenet longicola]GHM59777.1 MAG: hypothetical protein sL5_07700 [Candidatus Mesenet longicola]